MSSIFSGDLGFGLMALAFASALVAAVAGIWALFPGAETRALKLSEQPAWARLTHVGFVVHATSVGLVLVNLLGMIITRQYQYHYVWRHSSNELPMDYVVASLWEGQEGSFLIWMVWHALLGLLVLRWQPQWRTGVLAVMASVQVVLASMVLGVNLSAGLVQALVITLVLLLVGWSVYRLWQQQGRVLALAVGVLGVLLVTNILRGQGGFWAGGFWQPAFVLETAFWLVCWGLFVRYAQRAKLGLGLLALVAAALLVPLVVFNLPLEAWRVGSSPFVLLREVFPGEEVFATNPDFVPVNGNGLNPLLQNYWMVIHPPTLFLGFALTLVPFAFVLAALLKGDYTGWQRPVAPWLVAGVLVLGVGIIMGGYWAYETLNFGGYWNWDPVENGSLVPWLVGVSSLHMMMAYRHKRVHLRLGMVLIISTFVLVLYATFLTRSGILGETSVHSFTDLGLSGQLVFLLLLYAVGVGLLLAHRWRAIPTAEAERGIWNRSFFLFLAGLVLIFAAVFISFVTSLPVFNKLLGTRFAPPAQLQFFYYKWTVWFGILIALLSGVGQFIYWTKIEKRKLAAALYRPFGLAVLALLLVVLYDLVSERWQFVYNDALAEGLTAAKAQGGLQLVLAYMAAPLLWIADELLLLTAAFTVLANVDILIQLLRRNRSNLKRLGGSLAHAGFGLMLLGVLFSAGYEQTVSINLSPTALGSQFPEERRQDNVLLVSQQPTVVPGYEVTYLGRKPPEAPVRRAQIVYAEEGFVRLGFTDAIGMRYGLDGPAENLLLAGMLGPDSLPEVTEQRAYQQALEEVFDAKRAEEYINRNIRMLRAEPLNGRALYTVHFKSLADSSSFVLYPEAELTDNMGLIAHPDRRVALSEDLYVHVTSVPLDEEISIEELPADTFRLPLNGVLGLGALNMALDSITVMDTSAGAQFAGYDLAAKAYVRFSDTRLELTYEAQPLFLVRGLEPQHLDDEVPELGTRVRFEGIDPEAGEVLLVLWRRQAQNDYITLKALRKPLINLLWLGTFVMSAGFLVAVYRRVLEARAGRKGPATQADDIA